MRGIEPDPRRRQHKVDVSLISEAPILEDLLQIELADYLVSSKHGVHVSPQSKICVDTSLVELDLHEAVGIGTDNKVHFRPVNHNNLLDVVDDVG